MSEPPTHSAWKAGRPEKHLPSSKEGGAWKIVLLGCDSYPKEHASISRGSFGLADTTELKLMLMPTRGWLLYLCPSARRGACQGQR
jgi:hypothetical protein